MASTLNTMTSRKIIHIDMDCFFAAVEMRDFPELKNHPIAVGGSSDRRGVIATCNYEARRFGVRSAMATAHAIRLCPQLKVVKHRMSVYKDVSTQIHEIFRKYTDLIEPLSLDEAYLDVTDSSLHHGSATLIAQQIRADIQQTLNLTASAGVAPNKFLAKIASDLNKPNGQYVITPNDVAPFVETLALEKIPGVGKATLERLHLYGLKTAADVQKMELDALIKQFGKFGVSLHHRSFGRDDREVNTSRTRKSIGVETTLPEDVSQIKDCEQIMAGLFDELLSRIERAGAGARIAKCGVKLKFSDFRQTTVEHQQAAPELECFKPLLAEAWSRSKGKSVRLIGLSVGLQTEVSQQLDLPLPMASNTQHSNAPRRL
ncbi:DNA polymerase IV [Echinimonas agarilytica]|uniref:DNA polymerase IV n=1 Tax=Echinimonas agarilytica TaxID=1215918 RepID=A0AA42B8I2_9GAMM|nr:DNA polymerase IV [Echinimonas agarilytica]MCM2680261.1 DNA polymerase IV [Echinimonas agarilytica]